MTRSALIRESEAVSESTNEAIDDLAKRLNKRGTETEEQKRKRLETAKVEMAAEKEFDRVIVNDDIDKAAEELWQILKLCAAKAES